MDSSVGGQLWPWQHSLAPSSGQMRRDCGMYSRSTWGKRSSSLQLSCPYWPFTTSSSSLRVGRAIWRLVQFFSPSFLLNLWGEQCWHAFFLHKKIHHKNNTSFLLNNNAFFKQQFYVYVKWSPFHSQTPMPVQMRRVSCANWRGQTHWASNALVHTPKYCCLMVHVKVGFSVRACVCDFSVTS